MSDTQSERGDVQSDSTNRRTFLSKISTIAMAGGLVSGYGMLGIMAGRYLYPSEDRKKAWMFVSTVSQMKTGDVLSFQSPDGQTVTVTRRGDQ